MVAPEIVDHGFKIALEEISLAEGSGWRPAQEGVVKGFVADFPAKYGGGIHRVPRVLLKEKPKVPNARPPFAEDAFGKALLDDGKSTIQALCALAEKFKAGGLPESACSPHLLEVLRTSTIAVQLVFYPTGDILERVAHNAHAHDEENNEYLPTTLSQKIKLVMQVKQAVLGGDWANVQKWFVDRYGQAKTPSVKRMILGARCLSQPLLDFIDERALRLGPSHGMKPTYFLQNDFFCGVDPKKASQRLDQDEQLQAARVMADILDSGRTVTCSFFTEKVRPPCCSWKRLSTIAGHDLSPLPSPLPSTDQCTPFRSAAPSSSSPRGRGFWRRSTQMS